MTELLIADTHFYHSWVIDYCNRPFVDVDEMNAAIVRNWNNIVKEDNDTVYHLGDVSFGDFGQTEKIIQQLRGRKILILGNHDDRRSRGWWNRVGFAEVHKNLLLRDRFLLSHKPTPVGDGLINIHGHTHNILTNLNKAKYKCVSVELINYAPITFEELCLT